MGFFIFSRLGKLCTRNDQQCNGKDNICLPNASQVDLNSWYGGESFFVELVGHEEELNRA